jgi:F0F1-type ATP synthase delta subunit
MNIIVLVVVQIVVFAGLVFFLRKMMMSSSSHETKRLERLSQEHIRKSQEAEEKLKKAEEESRKKLDEAAEEIRRLNIKVTEETEKLRNETLKKAREEADKLTQVALNSKDKIRQELLEQQSEHITEQSLKLLRRVLSSKNFVLVHKGLINDIMEQMAAMDASRIQIQVDQGELVVPLSIDPEDKAKIVSILSTKTGRSIVLTDVIDPNLIAGIIIKLGNFVIDASLSKQLKETAEQLRKM